MTENVGWMLQNLPSEQRDRFLHVLADLARAEPDPGRKEFLVSRPDACGLAEDQESWRTCNYAPAALSLTACTGSRPEDLGTAVNPSSAQAAPPAASSPAPDTGKAALEAAVRAYSAAYFRDQPRTSAPRSCGATASASPATASPDPPGWHSDRFVEVRPWIWAQYCDFA